MNLGVTQRDRVDAALGSASIDQRTLFWARVDRLLPGATAVLEVLYPAADHDSLIERLLVDAATAVGRRKRELLGLDAARSADPKWFQSNEMVGYVAYAERFGGTLDGVRSHLDHLSEFGVSYLHLMHVLRARDGANDGGYAVIDYSDVEPTLGTRSDLEALADDLRGRGISLCLDLVLNHTAREHPWAQAARDGSAKHRAYYLVFPDRTIPDAYEATLPEVFPEMAPGSFTFDEQLDGWVWTTFHNYQWDLNYANPDVFAEMLAVMLDLANVGVDVLRLDAVAFTWKRIGTNCQNQPEAHLIAQAFRAFVAMAAPAVVLKAEAIVAPGDLLAYLGAHRNQRRECQLAYHNQLMVMLWSCLASRDARLAVESLASLPPTPTDAGWVSYLRCHDDIGWAVDDAAAARAGLNGPAHRRFLASFYRGDFPGSFADGVAFSSNPDADDERTCGTAAALVGLDAARRNGDPAAIADALERVLLGYAVVFSFSGIPLIYMGDELGLGNDHGYVDDERHADDSRWIHRPAMPWKLVGAIDADGSIESRLSAAMRHLSNVRRDTVPLSDGGVVKVHRVPVRSVLAWERRHPEHGGFFAIANFADEPVSVPRAVLGDAGLDQPVEILGWETQLTATSIELPAHGIGWFVDMAETRVQPLTPPKR